MLLLFFTTILYEKISKKYKDFVKMYRHLSHNVSLISREMVWNVPFWATKDSILVSGKIQFTCLRLNLPFGHDISIYRSRIQFTVQKIQFTVRSWDFNLLFEHEISIYPILPSAHEISIYPRPWDFNLPFEQERFQFTSERVCSNRKFNSFYGKFLL